MLHQTPAGSDRSESFQTLVVAVVVVAVLALSGTASAAATTSPVTETPQGNGVNVGNPTAPPISELDSVACTSQEHCVATGISVRGAAESPRSEAVAQTMFGIAATTSDGGGHWVSVSLPTRIETPPAISCPSANCVLRSAGRCSRTKCEGRR